MPDTSQTTTESIRKYFHDVGLTDSVICRVVLRGETERDSETRFDPPTRGGMTAYYERVRALREELVPLGWSFENTKNLCTTITPCGRYAIAFVSGDPFTGNVDRAPQPTYPRGAATAFAVNHAQLDFFEADQSDADEQSRPQIWFLVVHRCRGENEVLVELSRPEAIAESGAVTAWVERHPLDVIDITDPQPLDEDYVEVEDAVEVLVSRKR